MSIMPDDATPEVLAKIEKGVDNANRVSVARRRALVEHITDDLWVYDLNRLADKTNGLAEAMGAEAAWIRASQAAKGGGKIYWELVHKLLHGPDDKWSGRGNDVKWSYEDGFRDAVQKIFMVLGSDI